MAALGDMVKRDPLGAHVLDAVLTSSAEANHPAVCPHMGSTARR
ncbi:hypothetical protein ACFFUP_17910 [Vibrio ostreicida]|uniref:Uncharacterized protein n=1 Tax=Vibrio ostreicida TaxID=526588 RepID=A0ABT8BX31_9VIBR|nr:hypothetical protein [Vibrio ostreicida]MDN3611382.1 hypothetical protein [Vibrio ostreicida]